MDNELLPRDQRPNGVNIRADTRVYFNGTVRFIDVGITAPSAKNIKEVAANLNSAAADMYANKKKRKYMKYLTEDSMKFFVPFIVETTGSLGSYAQEFMKMIKRNKHRLVSKKVFKDKLKAFRHDQVLICAKNNSKLLQTGYDNQTVIQNGGVDDSLLFSEEFLTQNGFVMEGWSGV